MNTNTQTNIRKQFVIGDVISESWQRVSGLKSPIVWGCLVLPYVLIYALVIVTLIVLDFISPNFMLAIVKPAQGSTPGPIFLMLLIVIALITYILWYFLCMAVILGVKQSIGLRISFSATFSDCMKVKINLFYLSILWLMLIGTGYLVRNSVIPHLTQNLGLHLILSLILTMVVMLIELPFIAFAVPLIVIKRYSVAKALNSSFDMIRVHAGPMVVCQSIMSVILFLSLFTGIGAIWTMPMQYAMMGIFFRDAYNLKAKPATPKIIAQNNSIQTTERRLPGP